MSSLDPDVRRPRKKQRYDCSFFHDGVHCEETFTALLDRLIHVHAHIDAGDHSRRTVSCWSCAAESYPTDDGVLVCTACGRTNPRTPHQADEHPGMVR